LALKTLGKRELSEGWAEAIKHGLLFDKELIDVFEENWKDLMAIKGDIVEHVIRRSIALKAIVVRQDEREVFGKRILLNYGHTIGHGIESMTGYGSFLHGEAVSIGMSAAVKISYKLGMVERDVVERQENLLKKFDLPINCPGLDIEQLLENINLDKKRMDGKIRWVLLSDIGKPVVRADVPACIVKEVVRELIMGKSL
jgi:3-dehydroquinate synthetase